MLAGAVGLGGVFAVVAHGDPPPTFAAVASIKPALYYIGDSAGSNYVFTVRNTGTHTGIGGVEISRPNGNWTIIGCTSPAGWSAQQASTKCRFRSSNSSFGIQPNGDQRQFTVKARTAYGNVDIVGTWPVVVSRSSQFDQPSLLKFASPTGHGLTTKAHTFQLTTAVVSDNPVTPGGACPPENKEALVGSTKTIVVCGRNRANIALTPTSAHSSLSGTFIKTPGTFVSSLIPAGHATSANLVLAQWTGTEITDVFGTGKKIVTQVGARADRTSHLRTFKDYSATSTPPVANDDAYSTNEDMPLNVAAPGVLANDTDAELDPLTASVVVGPSHGSLTLNADGSFDYTPDANYFGPDAFTYRAHDTHSYSNVATVGITVHPVNDLPVGNDDAQNVGEDSTGASVDVLANDTDVDGDTLAVSAVDTTGTTGTVTNNGTDVTYDPNGQFESLGDGQTATDTFTYTVSDGAGGTDTATVTITIVGDNDDPNAVDDAYSTDEATQIGPLSILTNDTDAEGAVTVTNVSATTNGGTVTNNGDGTVTFNPDGDFEDLATGASRDTTFTYTITDAQGATDTATVTVTVNGINDAPVANDDAANVGEDSTGDTIGVLNNDTDAESQALNVTAVDTTGTTGTVTNNGNNVTYDPNGQFEYLGDGQTATDVFTYTVTDAQGATDTATVTITIVGDNDDPNAVDDAYSTDEATQIGPLTILANDTDAEGAVTVTNVSATTNGGTVTNNGDGTVTFNPNGAFEDLGNGQSRDTTFTYTITDAQGATDTATVTVTVNGINDAPVGNDDAATVPEDSTGQTVNVLGNDTDAESQTLTVTAVDTTGTTGSVTNNGTNVTYDPNGQFEYLGDTQTATDVFTYTVTDSQGGTDTATVTITIDGDNDDPVALDDVASTDEATSTGPVNVLINDSDAEGSLTVTAVGTPTNGGTVTNNNDGTVTFDPAGAFEDLATGQSDTSSFTYTVTDLDGATDTATVTVTVNGINDAPVGNDDAANVGEDSTGQTVNVLGNDTDAESQTLTISAVDTTGTTGTVTNNGGTDVTYDPNGQFEHLDAGETATDTFTYTVSDSQGATDTATVTITIDGANDAPVAVDDAYQAVQDTQLDVAAPGVLANDTDADVETLTAGNASDPANGTVLLNGDGSFSYTPDSGYLGADSFTYDVTDGTATDTATVNITVVSPNATPVAQPTSDTVAEDGGPITITLTGTDADDDDLTFDVGTANDGTVGPVGAIDCTTTANTCTTTVTYEPDPDFNGSDLFTFRVHDGTVFSTLANVSITVTAVNDPPTFTEGNDQTVNEDAGPQTVNNWATNISGGPADESQAVTFTVTNNNNALFSTQPAVSPDGHLTYTPAADMNGSATVSVKAVDGGGAESAVETFTITVTAVNDTPSFTAGGDQTVNEDAGAQTVNPWATAISKGPGDESGQTLTFNESTNNDALFAVLPAVNESTGALTYTPAANKYGTATVTVTLSDNGGGANTSAPQMFTITVNAVNDAPSAAAKSYNVHSNMKVSLSGLLTGATDTNDTSQEPGYTPTFTVGAVSVGAGCVGCTVSNVNNANGTFDFEPPAGQTGSFSISYTVVDSGFPAPGVASASQTITLTVAGDIVWFVDTVNGTDAANRGTLTRPFKTLAAAAGVDLANQKVFVHTGTYAEPFTLLNGEWLVGQGAKGSTFDSLLGLTPPETATENTADRPAINGTNPSIGALTLGSGNTVRGVTLTGAPALSGSSFGTLTLGNNGAATTDVVINTTGQAISLTNGTINGDFVSTTSTGGTDNVNLTNVGTTTSTSLGSGVTPGALSGATDDSLEIDGVGGTFSFTGPITNAAAGEVVRVANKTGGTVSLSGAINDSSGTGVVLSSNTGATINLTGGVDLSTGAGNAFAATGGGTVTVTGGGNTLQTTTGTALNIANTTIGAADVTFESINTNGAQKGIVLDTTGSSGNLVVTGTGSGTCTLANTTGCNGGSILNSTGADDSGTSPIGTGIVLNSTRDVSLTRMRVSSATNYGIRGRSVVNLTLSNVVVDGTNGTNAAAPFSDSSMLFDELTGTVSFTNVEVSGGRNSNVEISNTSGTLNSTFTTNRFGAMQATAINDALQVEGTGTAQVNANVQTSTFTSAPGDQFQYISGGSGGGTLTFNGNTLTNSHAAIVTGGGGITVSGGVAGATSMTITNNTLRDAKGNAYTIIKNPGTGSVTGTFTGNTVGVAGTANSGSLEGSGISMTHSGTNTMAWTIQNNFIHQYNNYGMDLVAGAGVAANGTLNLAISGNTLSNPGNNGAISNIFQGIHVNSGVTSGDSFTTCVDFGANTINGSGRNGGVDFAVRQRQVTTIRLPGYAGANNSNASAVAFVQGKIGGSPTGIATNTVASGGGGFVGLAC